jgi:hypothetical protein
MVGSVRFETRLLWVVVRIYDGSYHYWLVTICLPTSLPIFSTI